MQLTVFKLRGERGKGEGGGKSGVVVVWTSGESHQALPVYQLHPQRVRFRTIKPVRLEVTLFLSLTP